MHALNRGLFQHDAARRRAHRQRARDRAAVHQKLKLIVGDVPVSQALQRRGHELTRPGAGLFAGGRKVRLRAIGKKVFLLGNDKLGRVDLHQWRAAHNRVADRADIELLDPALELRVDDRKPPLTCRSRKYRYVPHSASTTAKMTRTRAP